MGSMDTFKQTAPVHKLKGNGIKVRGSPNSDYLEGN